MIESLTTVKPSVKIAGLNYYFGEGDLKKQVLYDINLELHPGEIVIMTGPSGSGKTTLLTLIGALRTAREGSLQVLDHQIIGMKKAELVNVRKNIGFIFQAHNLFHSLTARQNVQMSVDLLPSQTNPGQQAADILTKLGLGNRVDYRPAALSGGQKQRVAIARALVNKPQLILADEPTAALDKQTGRDVVTLMQKLAKEDGITILMVTHDNRILDVADRIIKMVDGYLTESTRWILAFQYIPWLAMLKFRSELMGIKSMRSILIILVVATFGHTAAAIAENLEHVNRALSTKVCQKCDLSNAGLVFAKLSGANLKNSNLREANLSRADLSFANLQNVDFRGASLLGANLNGADLTGANLSSVDLSGVNFSNANLQGANLAGSDLRRAYFGGANITGTNFANTFLRGAIGIPVETIKAEEYYSWGVDEDRRGNYRQAIEYFNKAVIVDPKFAIAYMGRAISLRQLGDVNGAISDAERAASLFEAQGDAQGTKLAKDLTDTLKNPPTAAGNGFGDILSGLGSLFLQFFLR